MNELQFKPANDKQKKFIESRKRYLLLSGAVGAGKSFIGCMKIFLFNLMYPGSRALICRKEARSMANSTIKTLLEKVIPQDMIVSYNQQKGELIHYTGIPGVTSSIVFCGLDKGADQSYPTKIGSTEYSWIFFDEGTEGHEGDWNMLSTRLRFKSIPNAPNFICTATNPDSPLHWMYKFFFGAIKPDREAYLTNPYENPYLPKGYLKSLEESLTGIARERLLLGKWVQAEGVIYKSFNQSKHVVDDSIFLPIKDYKMLYFGADSNYPLPRAGVLIGFRADGSVDILSEFYQEGAHVEDLIRWLLEWQVKREWTIYGFHDPSDPAAIDKLNRTQGLSCDKADNSVVPGISTVSWYFDKNMIRISNKCTNLIKELQSYRWKKEGDSPVKEFDHLSDSLRYCLHSVRPKADPVVYSARIFN